MQVLIDKSFKDYDYFSRYTPFPYYYNTLDDKYVYGITSKLTRDIPSQAYKVRKGDTFDSIALYFYNNPTLWWVITDFNRINDALSVPKEGSVLNIPTLSEVSFVL